MGCDKALLRIAGEPLWERQLNLLRALQPQALWISSRSVPEWSPSDIEVVLDAAPSRGPLSGICACLQRVATSHLLVVSIDMPRMRLEHLRELLSQAQPGRSLIPFNGDYFEPTCAIYSQTAAGQAAAALASDASLQRFIRTLIRENLAERYFLQPQEIPLYLNLNRPADLDSFVSPNQSD